MKSTLLLPMVVSLGSALSTALTTAQESPAPAGSFPKFRIHEIARPEGKNFGQTSAPDQDAGTQSGLSLALRGRLR
jgi:hypothetical protein